MMEIEDRISPLMKGRSVLVTGGMDIIGMALIEKLLRCSLDIYRIYLPIRLKKGQSVNDCLNEIFKNSVFEVLKKERFINALKQKCHVIEGDCSLLDLGISRKDRELIKENVSIIYHCAATDTFNEALKKSVLLNTRGTRELIALAKECAHLELFAYMSTAYCHPEIKVLEEKIYPPPADPYYLINLVEGLESHEVDHLSKKLLGRFPNSYTYTKALAEDLVDKASEFLPTLIMRPSIIVGSWKEPMPGWTNGTNGAMGALIGVSKGLIRTMVCDSEVYGDYMFIDLAINYVLVATWNFIQNHDMDRKVYNVVSAEEFRVPFRTIYEMDLELATNNIPLNDLFWYPNLTFTTNHFIYMIQAFFFHWLPAYFTDVALYCTGRKAFMYRLQTRIAKALLAMEHYQQHQYNFDNSQLLYLRTLLNKIEQDKYQIYVPGLSTVQYLTNSRMGIRRHVLRDNNQTLGKAKVDLHSKWTYHWILKIMIISLIVYIFYKVFCVDGSSNML